jgi:hypothetical protein
LESLPLSKSILKRSKQPEKVSKAQKVRHASWTVSTRSQSEITKKILDSLIYHAIDCDFQGKTAPIGNNGRPHRSTLDPIFTLIRREKEICENVNTFKVLREPGAHSFGPRHRSQCSESNLAPGRRIGISGENQYSQAPLLKFNQQQRGADAGSAMTGVR